MTAALAYKELRESAWIAALGLAAMLVVVGTAIGYSPLPMLVTSPQNGAIPFVSSTFESHFGLVAAVLAVALGLRQALVDFSGSAQLFLLHRPVSRERIYGTKVAIGLALYLLCAAVPIVLYALWASLPGTHASPFAWSMTAGVWSAWLAMTAVYLGALLAGLRPASWWGSRLAPLACGALVAILVGLPLPGLPGLGILVLADVWLVWCILNVARTRDFA